MSVQVGGVMLAVLATAILSGAALVIIGGYAIAAGLRAEEVEEEGCGFPDADDAAPGDCFPWFGGDLSILNLHAPSSAPGFPGKSPGKTADLTARPSR